MSLDQPWKFRGPGHGPGRDQRPWVFVSPAASVVSVHGEEITLVDDADCDRWADEKYDGSRIVFTFDTKPPQTFEVKVLDSPEEVLRQVERRSGWFDPDGGAP